MLSLLAALAQTAADGAGLIKQAYRCHELGDDGVFGLQRGFKNAGVRSLLVSLSEVADASTADMMIAFYRHLADGSGLTKREALRRAQKEIRAAYPGDDTWASFILIDSFN